MLEFGNFVVVENLNFGHVSIVGHYKKLNSSYAKGCV